MAVHNHGSEEGPGLSCNEVTLTDGSVKGVCLLRINDGLLDTALRQVLLNLYYADASEETDGEIKYSFDPMPEAMRNAFKKQVEKEEN